MPVRRQLGGAGAERYPLADVATKYLSHELSETLTDPVNGGGWWDNSSGNEDGDNCNFFGATVDPQNSSNPNAFGPVLGGSAAAGTLFDQIINGDHYYTQTEWSNGELNCEAKPVSRTLTRAFHAPRPARPDQLDARFDPQREHDRRRRQRTPARRGTSATARRQSFTTSRSRRVTKPGQPHLLGRGGTYTVTLTVVDVSGNLASVSHQITVGTAPPVALHRAGVSQPG